MGRKVLYLNWDGFAYYYYQLASQRKIIPTIEGLKSEGAFFTNLWCGVPPITNPMQTAISSGAYSEKTKNVKIYYDREKRMVVEQRRQNEAENIVHSLFSQGHSVASVHHFTFEENGTYAGDLQRPYIFVDNSAYAARFQELLRLYAGKPVHTGGRLECIENVPDFVAAYFEDLDTVGHNNGKMAPPAVTEDQRVENVLWRLQQMDTALGHFIEGLKELGLYDQMAIFLLTDHGMTPFSFNDQSAAAYQDLLTTLEKAGYRWEVLKGEMSPAPTTQLVLCTAGLSLLLRFVEKVPMEEVAELKRILSAKEYVGKILDRNELAAEGSMDFCDLYVSPKPPFIFKDHAPQVGATHDSLDETARHIFSLVWGNGIRKGIVSERKHYNIEFAPTMAALLQAEPPKDCTAAVMEELLEKS